MPSTFDPARLQFALKGDTALGSYGPAVTYAQEAHNRLGVVDNRGQALTVDGKYGPRTASAVANFQRVHPSLPVNGVLDRWTWHYLDWCIYDGWKPAPVTLTRDGPNGLAIVKGHNKYSGEPVNARGLTREAQRLADVTNWIAPVDFRPNFAVDRDQRGNTGRLSMHALGVANDDMTDLDRDRVLERNEIDQCNMVANALVARTTGWPVQYGQREGRLCAFVGPDRIATVVWGNHRNEDGSWNFPLAFGTLGRNADYSWTPPRRTWKRGSGRVHANHLHVDTVSGAPKWTVTP